MRGHGVAYLDIKPATIPIILFLPVVVDFRLSEGAGNCGVVWNERSTSRGPVEDARNGSLNDVSTKAGGQSNHHGPHHNQIGVRMY